MMSSRQYAVGSRQEDRGRCRPTAYCLLHTTRCGFTLIEMLTTVAMLVIVLGLMVSLARYVRYRSANELTRELLVKLDSAMNAYLRRSEGQLPPVALVPPDNKLSEPAILTAGWKNNEQWVRALRMQEPPGGGTFSDLPVTMYDEVHLRDAWDRPIILMPRQHPAIGMAPEDRFFFFSAGPDRQFLTRDDNLYSYEAGK